MESMAVIWEAGHLLTEVGGLQPVAATREEPGHPHHLKLKAFLDDVERQVGEQPEDDLFLDLEVEVGADDLLTANDLKTYLIPLVQRLGESRFVLVRGHKQTGTGSRLRIGTALPAAAPEGFSAFHYRTTSTGDDWQSRDHFRKALLATRTTALPDGPAELAIAWSGAVPSNWVHLWEPTSVVLGPILGEHRTHEPFNPRQERVTDVSLHRIPGAEAGPAVEVRLYWRPASDAPRSGRILRPSISSPGFLEAPTLAHDLVRFSDNDAGYLHWLSLNPTGYVLNIHRRPTPSSVHILHVATCPHLAGTREHYTTSEYVKMCSSREQALLDWAESTRGLLRHCGTCG